MININDTVIYDTNYSLNLLILSIPMNRVLFSQLHQRIYNLYSNICVVKSVELYIFNCFNAKT